MLSSAHKFGFLTRQLKEAGLNNDVDFDEVFLDTINQCKACNGVAKSCLPALNISPSVGCCFILHCESSLRNPRCAHWYACINCQKRLDKRRVKAHFTSRGHNASMFKSDYAATKKEPQRWETTTTDFLSRNDLESVFESDERSGDEDASSLYLSDVVVAAESVDSPTEPSTELTTKMTWVEKAFYGVPVATVINVMDCFEGNQNMLYFWVAQHSDGGMQFLAARTFQRTVFVSSVPSQEEARWHMLGFIQYQSMGDRQRKRQAMLTHQLLRSFSHHSVSASGLVYAHQVLSYRDLNRYYGKTSDHSLWNALPIPRVEFVGGIAYVSPIEIVRYVIAMGIEVDDILYDPNDTNDEEMEDNLVFDIADSQAIHEMRKEAARHELPTEVLLLWCVDWRDGFCTNRAKSMRKSVVAWTFTVAPPKSKINAVDNTFALAVGLKKNANWSLVEHKFQRDMAILEDMASPLRLYHGRLKKVIPVVVKRISSLEDKVERADISRTIACTSPQHKIFGISFRLTPPTIKIDDVKDFLFLQSSAPTGNEILRRFGWSCTFIEKNSNSGILPSCLRCRVENLKELRSFKFDEPFTCDECANWTLSPLTKARLRFPPPDDYPSTKKANAPIPTPPGRDVGTGDLEFVDLDFDFLKMATKFAFFNSYGPTRKVQGIRQGWTKKMCMAYLGACGVNTKIQSDIHDFAQAAYEQNEDIDYNLPDRVGGFHFAASWLSPFPLKHHIETVMHLLFLGIAKSNMAQTDVWLKNSKKLNSFRKGVQDLLRELSSLSLSWLLLEPFSNSTKETKFSTGTWVGENWLGWIRISKVTSAWYSRHGVADEQAGSNDIARLCICYYTLVAHLLTHSGVNKQQVLVVSGLIKEFLSCSNELDVRLRYKEINKKKKGATQQQFWQKANYLSLLNLVWTILYFGPLKNMWDGGGKGERFIQKIKPLVPRGVRDNGFFFVRLVEKLYKLGFTEFLEELCNLVQRYEDDGGPSDDDDSDTTIDDVESLSSMSSDEDQDLSHDPAGGRDEWFTPAEDEQMSKARTLHIYRSRDQVDRAFAQHLPIAGGIFPSNQTGLPTFYTIHKSPNKSFGWRQVLFDDANGATHCNCWYTPLTVADPADEVPATLEDIKSRSKLAAVAIPLRYVVGNDHVDRLKYCVITNWWRERDCNGNYSFPELDYTLYSGVNTIP